MERRRGCASRCAAASMVDSGRVAPISSTHLEAATCCTAAVHAAALRKAAAGSDGSQLRKRGRKAAGASTHRPLRSMSRCVSNAPLMWPPLSQQRRRHGQRRPSNGDFKPLSLATSANALWEKGLCPPQGGRGSGVTDTVSRRCVASREHLSSAWGPCMRHAAR